jgi:hypothetical protein
VWVIKEGAFSFLRAAYEAVVKGVVCANGGGEGVVCGWRGQEEWCVQMVELKELCVDGGVRRVGK